MTQSILGIVPDPERAEQVVGDLRAGGYYDEEISVIFCDWTGTRDFAHEHNTHAPEGALVGGPAGGLIGTGVPEHEAQQYERMLRAGDVLLSVLVVDRGRRQLARDILELNRARDISVVGDTLAPASYRAHRA
jgi:hypothetical protein